MANVAVIGAGLTGLGAASRIERAGHRVTVFEAGSQVGGNIRSIQNSGYLVEEGPNTIQLSSAEHENWLREAAPRLNLIEADPAASKRYLVRHGRAIAVPGSPVGFLGTPLFSFKAKLRLIGELFARKPPPDTDESLSSFVLRRLGREMLDYAITPFVGGVYAGNPDQLSVRYGFPKLFNLEQDHRSLILGSVARRRERRRAGTLYRTRLVSFPDGLQALPRQLADSLREPVRLSTPVAGLDFDGQWRIRVGQPSSTETIQADAVVLALPATALASLRIRGSEVLRTMGEIKHPPVVSYAMGFRRDQIAHPLDGFGALIPALEPFRILGTLFSSSLFPGRAPEDHVLLTTFVGGTRAPELAGLPIDELRALILRDLEKLLGLHGAPVFEHRRLWPRAIPQYEVGHGRFLQATLRVERENPGLQIGGNARDGISLSYCIEGGRRLAGATLDFLAKR
ncbi:MAG: protoporphyrinogen oxidase [Opitutaceae bacterium]